MVVFVIHGHEVLKTKNYYPEPYKFSKGKLYPIKSLIKNIYDIIKCIILKIYISKNLDNKLKIIFVSNQIKSRFLENISVSENALEKNSVIISNCIGKKFIEERYSANIEKKYDFVTIRPFDDSTKAMDIVLKVAINNPEYSFHIYGNGRFFDFYKPPKNITVFNHYIKNDEIPALLNNYKAALMPTRLDSQGVSMCEMATFGIPMVVSDIKVCHEMLNSFSNIFFLDNDNPTFSAKDFLSNINHDAIVDKQKFSLESTVLQEIEYIKSLI